MTTSLIERNKSEAKKKGVFAAAAWGGTALFFAASVPLLWVPGAVGAGYLTWKWFMFRARNGIRF
ncbi:MAG TPA: hypothetical protein VHJ20_12890 [Polyangia bacterium]|nr:hypothetical protein [Polyangia bacterium]